MKQLLRLIVLSLSLLLIIPLLFVESSSLTNDSSVSNITRGSSISTTSNKSSCWLSPSGNIAFGFYLLPCTRSSPNCRDRYVVGIWYVKSPQKTLVWTANRNDLPVLHKQTSILLTEEGKLVLRIIPDNKDKLLLPDVPEAVSYAKMHDDGNFVLYGSDSQIVWESFDYPTDTILGGQKLRPRVELISINHRLSVKPRNGLVAIYEKTDDDERDGDIISRKLWKSLKGRSVVLSLDTTGKLYLASYDDEVVKVLYEDKQNQQVKEEGDYMYRATLSSLGHFDLHKDRIDGNDSHNETVSSIVWSSYKKPPTVGEVVSFVGMCLLSYALIGVCLKQCCGVDLMRGPDKDKTGAELELGSKPVSEGDLESGKK